MRKKIYCSGWGAISEPVSKLSSVGAALPRLCPQSSECESSHRNRRIEGFLPSFKIVIAPTFLRF
ncbi:hypothetical protein [Leptospira borgpetersenii]|uniref:hypothetical protein n=1 Tax=Leptospira borgpetersenii TaxID=174 RepID=UPI0009BCDAB9|nr:hypothetical protein [Leptospira borgpetersenii]